MQNSNPTESHIFNDSYEDYEDGLKFRITDFFSYASDKIKEIYNTATNSIDDEFAIPVSQDQVNAALEKFVTKNVKAIHEIRVELHEGWFRLFCTLDIKGIYAEVASNFDLVQVQLDRDVQRFVFAQKTNTDVLKLRCESFLKLQGIKTFIWFYHRILKKDPLGFILSYIGIARPKDNIIYLEIGRWLKKNKKIMNTLHKVQVNHGVIEKEQMTLKAQINARDIFANTSRQDIITPDDEPELMQGPFNPISDAIEPSVDVK